MIKKSVSTFEREMKNPRFKRAFKKSYKKLLLSELLIAMMERDEKSVRGLAKEVGLSATIIQKLRSRRQTGIKINNFVKIAHACGYQVILEKGNERILLEENRRQDIYCHVAVS